MCVYRVDGPHDAAPGCAGKFHDAGYAGCYHDRNRDRAMPHEVHGKNHSPEDCHEACSKAGYEFFGRQWRGQCFCGEHVSVWQLVGDFFYILTFCSCVVCSLLLCITFPSNQPIQGYDKHGSVKDCDCCGRNVGANKMCVWEVKE